MTDEFSPNKIELKEGLKTLLSGKPVILLPQGVQWPWQIKNLYDDEERFTVIEYQRAGNDLVASFQGTHAFCRQFCMGQRTGMERGRGEKAVKMRKA
jgi:hypothetical protein